MSGVQAAAKALGSKAEPEEIAQVKKRVKLSAAARAKDWKGNEGSNGQNLEAERTRRQRLGLTGVGSEVYFVGNGWAPVPFYEIESP